MALTLAGESCLFQGKG